MTDEEKADRIDYSFLSGGLLYRILVKAGLAKTGLEGITMRTVAVVFLTYVPILALAMVQGVAWNPALQMPFVFDISETCRFLMVAPLLVASEAFVDPWIVQLIRYIRARLISTQDLSRYEQLLTRTARLRDSSIIEILLLVSTFGWQWIEVHVGPKPSSTNWHNLMPGNDPTYAYLWCIYFAKPLVRFLWLRWIWRYFVWSFFLCRLSMMPLKIVPTYPDKHGGLWIIAAGHGRFLALALTFGAQVSSILAEQMLYEGKSLVSFKYEIVGVVAIVLLIFLTPLLAFSNQLINAKRKALFEYGALAEQVSSAFHTTWISGNRERQELLSTGEVQSLSALSKTYQIVRDMSIILIGKENVTMFVAATLLPFTPLLLLAYPFDELMKHVLKAVI